MEDRLQVGSRGAAVCTAQALLNYHARPRNPIMEDGIFGPTTRSTVIEFQRTNHLIVDGIIGPQTAGALFNFRRLQVIGTFGQDSAEIRGHCDSLLPPVPDVKLPESLRSLPPTGLAKTSSVDRPLPVPDWFYNNLPQNRSAWRLNDAQLSLGQEIDIPKDSDSAPVQFVAELTYIEQRNGRPISPGVQFSYTPRSADGKLSGLVYVKVGLPDQRIPKVGIWSLYDLTYQLYVKKVSHSPWVVGGQIANESTVTLARKEGSYSAKVYLSIGLQLDFFNLEAPHFILRAATVIGLGFKLILDTPKYKPPARNKMP